MGIKITELKITLCLILLFVIMTTIAFCSYNKFSKVEHPESTVTTNVSETKQNELNIQSTKVEPSETRLEEESIEEETIDTTAEIIVIEPEPQVEALIGSEKFGLEEALMLHKISIAEAGGESIESMAIIMNVILNRVADERFPNSIEGVIFEKVNGVAQFSPIIDGNYNKANPNEKSYEAMKLILNGWDKSQGALYFEACENGSSWHNTALEFLFEKDGVRYYK